MNLHLAKLLVTLTAGLAYRIDGPCVDIMSRQAALEKFAGFVSQRPSSAVPRRNYQIQGTRRQVEAW